MSDEETQAQALEELRRKQTEELQKRLLLKQILDNAAYERISNIRLANKALYDQLAMLLFRLYQSGQLKGKISEKQLLSLLSKVREQRKEPEIKFLRK